MAIPFYSYTPRGVKRLQGSQTGSMVSAGSRAQIRHGIASAHSSMAIGDGLHAWDMTLRQDAGPLVRENFIKDTECDMHDAAVALDRVTGGFTMVLHCRGSAQTSTSPPLPEEMEFTAYITRDEIEQHAPKFDAAIARMAQIFAADIMPHHSKNYRAKCTSSSVATDTAVIASRVASMQTPLLIPPALSASSMYIFQGYHPGYLESFLLRPIYNTIIAPHSNGAIRAKSVKQSLPSPAVIDRAIDQICFQTPRPQLSKVSPSSNASSPTKLSSIVSPAHIQQSMMKCFINSQGEGAAGCGIAKDEKGTGAMKKSRQTPQTTTSTSRLAHLEAALSQSTRFGSPSSSTLFSSPSLRRGGSPSGSSISSVSTTDYWAGEDESIFQGDADPSVAAFLPSGSSPLKGKGPLALPSTPSVLIPIISMGSKTETAISESGLPDSVHNYLRNLVATRVTTAWVSNLQAPPLLLSSTTAEKLHRAVLHDVGAVL